MPGSAQRLLMVSYSGVLCLEWQYYLTAFMHSLIKNTGMGQAMCQPLGGVIFWLYWEPGVTRDNQLVLGWIESLLQTAYIQFEQ